MLARTKLSSKAGKLKDDVPRRVWNNDDKTMGWLGERAALGKRIATLIGPRLSTFRVLRFARLTIKILVESAKVNMQRSSFVVYLFIYSTLKLISKFG